MPSMIRQAAWSVSRGGGRADRGDQAGAEPVVVAEPVDVDAVVRRGRVDLEVDRLPLVDADVGGEALDARVAGPADVPLLGGVPG